MATDDTLFSPNTPEEVGVAINDTVGGNRAVTNEPESQLKQSQGLPHEPYVTYIPGFKIMHALQ